MGNLFSTAAPTTHSEPAQFATEVRDGEADDGECKHYDYIVVGGGE